MSEERTKRSTELVRLEKFKEKLGLPFRTVGRKYYIYEKGVWRVKDRNLLRPMALSVIDPEDRTAYAEKAILDLAESETQIDPSRFRGCAAFDDLGRVL